jgi:ERCC4-type nuclease
MQLIVDVRESTVWAECQDCVANTPYLSGVQLSQAALPLGDMLLRIDGEEVLIFERKTFADLISSVKDKRYEEQSHRLQGSSFHNHSVVYVIEGNFDQFRRLPAVSKQVAYSAIASLNAFKGFSVTRSSSAKETAFLLCSTAFKLAKEFAKGKTLHHSATGGGEGGEGGDEEVGEKRPAPAPYSDVVKRVKKDNITSSNIDEIMLSQVPGISPLVARTVLAHFDNSLAALIHAIWDRPQTALAGIRVPFEDKPRALSKAVARKLEELFPPPAIPRSEPTASAPSPTDLPLEEGEKEEEEENDD